MGQTNCHRRRPSFSSRHSSTDRSPLWRGSRGESLFVPMNTRPWATTGVDQVWLPSDTTHLMFWPVAGSKLSTSPVSAETMLRVKAWPHWAWSPARTVDSRKNAAEQMIPEAQNPNFIFVSFRSAGILPVILNPMGRHRRPCYCFASNAWNVGCSRSCFANNA